MMQPGRTWSVGSLYRYGFNGKENDNEVKGNGNQQDYGMRIYDPRLGRFSSIDPIARKFPELSGYQFASNRPIDGIDLDGMEYKSAADWAQQNIANYTFAWDDISTDIIPFKKLRKSNWRDVVGKYMYCATSTSLTYGQGNKKVADYLQSRGFETNRLSGQLAFFTNKSGSSHYLIKPKDWQKADRGDLLFIQDPNRSEQGSGHVAILATNTRTQQAGGFTVNVYTTNAGITNDPTRESNLLGEAIYYFEKQSDGKYILAVKWIKNVDTKKWERKDMKSKNLQLQGFGRIDEEKIDPSSNKEKPKDEKVDPKIK